MELSRYQLGADSCLAPKIVDCSSFTQWLFKECGTDIPRLAADQARMATRVPRLDIRPGDLIFMEGFCYRNVQGLPPDHVGHVGIIEENLRTFIHATHRPNGVTRGIIDRIPDWRFRFFARIEI